jgi:hypothetical protein
MQKEYLIAVAEFCTQHNIAVSFVSSLQQTGLINVITVEDAEFIDAEDLKQLERYVHFHYELDINIEGIESIMHLLLRVNMMQDEITELRNRLCLYE